MKSARRKSSKYLYVSAASNVKEEARCLHLKIVIHNLLMMTLANCVRYHALHKLGCVEDAVGGKCPSVFVPRNSSAHQHIMRVRRCDPNLDLDFEIATAEKVRCFVFAFLLLLLFFFWWSVQCLSCV